MLPCYLVWTLIFVILASETCATTTNTYSQLLRSSLGQSSTTAPPESSALSSGSGGHNNYPGGSHSSHGGRVIHGGFHRGRHIDEHDDRKCDPSGGTSYTEPNCSNKYGNSN